MRKRSYGILWVAFAILVLGGLYLGLQTTLKEDEAGELQSAAYRLSISALSPGEVLPVFKATQGDTVTLAIRSDRPGELDVHGYEKKIDLEPDGEVTLTFTADKAGAFPMYLHMHEPLDPNEPDGPVSHRHLATLDVQPK